MSKRWIVVAAIIVALILVIAVIAMTQPKEEIAVTNSDRLMSIPDDAAKMTPALDNFKPVVLSNLWEQPVPMPGPVNTAGAEDSAFITPDGNWFFFFFTPDVSVPPEKQLIDGVTGIWWMQRNGTSWTSPEKIVLNDDVALDGAEFVLGNTMWFASVRTGNYGEIDIYTAEYEDGEWTNVTNAGEQLNVQYDIGEFHITSDGQTMYFHGGVSDTADDLNIWVTQRTDDGWSTPVIVPNVSSDGLEGWPYVTSDGNELWFTSFSSIEGYQGPSIYRSIKQGDGSWGDPEEIVANFAGEPTLDDAGNIYFTHHYFTEDSEMIEADIYVAYAV
ncbi:MAG TPA: hypothetical protein VMW71_04750 [Thermoplasmata archaeon]|nr:hypothetical protein [Thermoplasmata archaeon]